MTDHLHPETLALLALGEEAASDADREHLDVCDTCRAELGALARVREAAVNAEQDDQAPPAPPPWVWEAIELEIASDRQGQESSEPAGPGVTERAGPEAERVVPLPGAGGPEAERVVPLPGAGGPEAERVVPLPAGRARRSRVAAALAVAASLLVGIVAGATLWQREDLEVVADTELEPLAEVAAGTARLVRADDALHLEVEAPDLPEAEGYYALWLIDSDVAGMISLGPLEPDRTYALPAGFDPSAFPVVDVSLEPFDGDPTHSGNSVLRGVLPLES